MTLTRPEMNQNAERALRRLLSCRLGSQGVPRARAAGHQGLARLTSPPRRPRAPLYRGAALPPREANLHTMGPLKVPRPYGAGWGGLAGSVNSRDPAGIRAPELVGEGEARPRKPARKGRGRGKSLKSPGGLVGARRRRGHTRGGNCRPRPSSGTRPWTPTTGRKTGILESAVQKGSGSLEGFLTLSTGSLLLFEGRC